MAQKYDCVIKMVALRGHCSQGHKIGDEWKVSGKTPEGLCLSAFGPIYPDLRTMQFGGSFPWGEDEDSVLVGCPDHNNVAVFEVRRIKE